MSKTFVLEVRFPNSKGDYAGSSKIYEYKISLELFQEISSLSAGTLIQIENEKGYDYRKTPVQICGIKNLANYSKDLTEITSLMVIQEVYSADSLEYLLNQKLGNFWTDYRSEIKQKKGKKSMCEKVFNNFKIGVAKDVKFSVYGPAFETKEKNFVSYDKKGNLIEVDGMTLDNVSNFYYAIPVAKKDVVVGDFIQHDGSWVKVLKITDEGYLKAEKIATKEVVEIIPTKNVFGFDFYVKLISLVGDFNLDVKQDSPFGMLPFLMMCGDDKTEDNFLPFLFMQNAGMSNDNFNNLLPLLLLNGDNNADKILPFLLMNLMRGNN